MGREVKRRDEGMEGEKGARGEREVLTSIAKHHMNYVTYESG